MTSTGDLATWLLEQIAEDERLAVAQQDAPASCPRWEFRPSGSPMRGVYEEGRIYVVIGDEDAPDALMEHIARWDPARVLAECDAKRQLLVRAWEFAALEDAIAWEYARDSTFRESQLMLKIMALPYADRAGYREEWRP